MPNPNNCGTCRYSIPDPPDVMCRRYPPLPFEGGGRYDYNWDSPY